MPTHRRVLLAGVVGGSPEQAVELAQHPLVRHCSAHGDDDALVALLGRLASDRPDPDAARGRLLQLVVDVEQRPLDDAATLLALAPQDAQALLDRARRQHGTPWNSGRCRGWPLVARPLTLTAAEQRAATGHLEVCHGCRGRRASVERARRDALARAAAVTALLGAAQVAALTAGGGAAAAGAGSLLAGKAAAAAVGALGAAVVVAGGVAAVAQQGQAGVSQSPVVRAPADVGTATTPSPVRSEVSGCAAPCAAASPAPVPPPVAGTSPAPAVPVPPVLRLPDEGGAVVLVPPSVPAVPSLPAVPSVPPVPSLPTVPSPPTVPPLLPVASLPPTEPLPPVPSLP